MPNSTHLKFMYNAAFITAFTAWSPSSIAIVNIENMRVGNAETGFSGNADIGVSGEQGNTDKQDIELSSRLEWQHDIATDFIVLSYEYGESNDVRDTNKSFAHARHVQPFKEKLAWEAFIQAEQDEFARLSFRGLIGAGLRFTLVEEQNKHALYLGTGAFHLKETLDELNGDDDDDNERFWRGNIYLAYKLKLNAQLSLSSTTYYQPRLDESNDFRALEQAALAIKMTEDLSFKVALDITHDSRPPKTVDQTDITYSTGLSYRF